MQLFTPIKLLYLHCLVHLVNVYLHIIVPIDTEMQKLVDYDNKLLVLEVV